MLAELRQAATDTAAGGSGGKWRSLPRQSRAYYRREYPAKQSGRFNRSWRAGRIEVKPDLRRDAVSIDAEINSTEGRALEIVASSASFFNNWRAPYEARRRLYDVFARTAQATFEREMKRA